MKLRTVFYLFVDIVCIVWIMSLARRPGGGFIYLALLFLGLAIFGFYIGFIKFRPRPGNIDSYIFYPGNAAISAGFFFMFALGAAYWGHQEIQGPAIINQWISMYPNITDISHAPPLHQSYRWYFFVESDDPPEKVGAFYEDTAHTTGWEKLKDVTGRQNDRGQPSAYMFEFGKSDYHLFIDVLPGKFDEGSRISYRLEDTRNHL